MAEGATPEEKTEDPTERRMEELRKEGQVHLSTELVQVAALVSGFLVLSIYWQNLFSDLQRILIRAFTMIEQAAEFDVTTAHATIVGMFMIVGPDLLVITLTVALIASLAVMLQTNWNVKEKKIHFRFSALNPITGVKRIISIQGVVTTLKAIAKLMLIVPIAYFGLKASAPALIQLIHTSVTHVLDFTGEACSQLFWRIISVLIALAIFDYYWTRYQWFKTNRMTKHEVKDERKSVEGDEKTKRRIQSKGLNRIAQRIRQSVPQADVVVTNPTHIAVALKYDRSTMRAPKVLAKGKGHMAEQIKKIAREAGIPVLERKPLARALYQAVEVGTEIPLELFRAVAKVLAHVYRLKRPNRRSTVTAPRTSEGGRA